MYCRGFNDPQWEGEIGKVSPDLTEKAIRGGGYSADKFVVGPQGGQVLVDETVKRIEALWD